MVYVFVLYVSAYAVYQSQYTTCTAVRICFTSKYNMFFRPLDAGVYSGIIRTRNLCELCKTSTPVPGTSVNYVQHSCPYPKLPGFFFARARIPGVRVQHSYTYLPGNSESSKISIPIPGTSVSSGRLPYPYPESTKPTEHNLGMFFGESALKNVEFLSIVEINTTNRPGRSRFSVL